MPRRPNYSQSHIPPSTTWSGKEPPRGRLPERDSFRDCDALKHPNEVAANHPDRYRDVSPPRWGTNEWPREQSSYNHRDVSPLGTRTWTHHPEGNVRIKQGFSRDPTMGGVRHAETFTEGMGQGLKRTGANTKRNEDRKSQPRSKEGAEYRSEESMHGMVGNRMSGNFAGGGGPGGWQYFDPRI